MVHKVVVLQILIGMDGSNPQPEFVKGPNDYFIFDNGVDIKTEKLELDFGSLQLSNTQNSMSLVLMEVILSEWLVMVQITYYDG